MKKLGYILLGIYGVLVFVSIAEANNVTDTLTSGQTPIQGDILYFDGVAGNTAGTWAQPSSIPGLQGAAGTDGVNGVDGAAGANGANGANGSKGSDGADGVNGVNGKNLSAPSIDPRMDVEVREFDSKHWSMSSYASFALQTGTARYVVGQKLTLKLGKSFEEKQRELLEKKLLKLMDNSVLLPVN